MTLMEWLASMFKRPDPHQATAATLDARQESIASRLSKLSGLDRDEVLSEAYRRARLLDEDQSFRRQR